MIIISGEIVVDPQHHETLIALVDAVEEPSRAEPGCEEYRLSVDRATRGVVHVFEIWSDADAIASHGATDHFKTFGRGLRALAPERVEVNQYDATLRG